MSYRKNDFLLGRYYLKKDLTKENLYYIKRLRDMIRTSFGPLGNLKVLFDRRSGKYLVTKDGARILNELLSFHPAISVVADAGISTKNEAGDGSLMATLLSCELFEKAVKLMESGLHPANIVEGYMQALRDSLEIINMYTRPLVCHDENLIFALAKSIIITKVDSSSANYIARLVTNILSKHLPYTKDYNQLSDIIVVRERVGGSIDDSKIFRGVLLHKSGVDLLMPKVVRDAKIAIVDNDLGFKRTGLDVNVVIKEEWGIKNFYKTREDIMNEIIELLVKLGVNILLCSGNISDEMRRILTRNNILAIRNVSLHDIKIIANATRATVVSNVKSLTPAYLGFCETVRELIVSALDRWTLFENCIDPRYYSLLIRGFSENIVASVKGSVLDCIKVISKAVNYGGYVCGGGSLEMRIATYLRKSYYKHDGKKQLALLAYADAIEDSIVSLGENCGIDPVSAKTQLRSAHNRGEMGGINAFTRSIVNMEGTDIIDAAHVKAQLFKSATEAAIMLIRADFGYFREKIRQKPKDVIPAPVKLVRDVTDSYLKRLSSKK